MTFCPRGRRYSSRYPVALQRLSILSWTNGLLRIAQRHPNSRLFDLQSGPTFNSSLGRPLRLIPVALQRFRALPLGGRSSEGPRLRSAGAPLMRSPVTVRSRAHPTCNQIVVQPSTVDQGPGRE